MWPRPIPFVLSSDARFPRSVVMLSCSANTASRATPKESAGEAGAAPSTGIFIGEGVDEEGTLCSTPPTSSLRATGTFVVECVDNGGEERGSVEDGLRGAGEAEEHGMPPPSRSLGLPKPVLYATSRGGAPRSSAARIFCGGQWSEPCTCVFCSWSRPTSSSTTPE